MKAHEKNDAGPRVGTEAGEDGAIKCDCCELPAAKVRGNTLVIRHRHHGKAHTTVIAVSALLKLVGQQESATVVKTIADERITC